VVREVGDDELRAAMVPVVGHQAPDARERAPHGVAPALEMRARVVRIDRVEKGDADVAGEADRRERLEIVPEQPLERRFAGRRQAVFAPRRTASGAAHADGDPSLGGEPVEQQIRGRPLEIGARGEVAVDELVETIAVHPLLAQQAEKEERVSRIGRSHVINQS